MLALGEISPKWRACDLETKHISSWDGEWFYHFREGGYSTLEWIEIQTESPQQHEAALEAIKKIHVPGRVKGDVIRVFGYLPPGEQIDYL